MLNDKYLGNSHPKKFDFLFSIFHFLILPILLREETESLNIDSVRALFSVSSSMQEHEQGAQILINTFLACTMAK